jgi:ligand-binding sensor domain-containing protein
MKRFLKDKRLVGVSLVALAIGALFAWGALSQIRKANLALHEEKQKSTEEDNVSVQKRNFSLAPNVDARLFAAPFVIRDVAAFDQKLYATTSNGLVEFSFHGRQLNHWTKLDGFPSQDLTAIMTTPRTLWIGTTESGLLRFENNQWTHFLPAAREQRSVHSLLATSQGDLLVGTDAGLLTFNSGRFKIFVPPLKNQKITSLAGDSRRLVIGTFSNGLYIYQGGVLRQFTRSNGLQDPFVTQAQIVDREIYVATPSGIQVLKGDHFNTVAKNVFATSFVRDPSALWVATRDRGIIPIVSASYRHAMGLQRSYPTFVKKIDSMILAASADEISYLDKGNQWKTWNSISTLLKDANVSSVLRTRKGELWIGYFDQGLDIVSASRNSATHIKDETIFCVNHISEDAKGRIYVSTANGLVIFQPDHSRRVYRTVDGLLSDRVMQTIPLDPAGRRIAIATAQGFTIKEGARMKSLYAFHGLVNNHVYSMAANGEDIFLGTLGGISRVSSMQVTGNWTQMDSGLKRNWVNALATINNRLFVGTYGSGIQVKTESGDWQDFPALPDDLEINPNALFFDGNLLFCGTLDRGFYVYDPRSETWKHIDQDLPSLNVTSFTADGDLLYVGTAGGLLQMKYDKISTIPDLG